MLTDMFTHQGVTHEICEDYAIKGDDFVILSDGCSNGGGPRIDSDWGSRFLCAAAEEHIELLKDNKDGSFFSAVGATVAAQQRSFPRLRPSSLSATLMCLAAQPLGNIKAIVMGDGVIGGRLRESKEWHIVALNYVSGAPFYLKYIIFDEDRRYMEKRGRAMKISVSTGTFGIDKADHVFGTNGELETQMKEETHDHELSVDQPWESYVYNEDYDLVFVATDGVESFYRNVVTNTSKHNEPIKMIEVVRKIFSILEFGPCFMQAQHYWNFKRNMPGTFLNLGWQNSDDISMGAIYRG